MTPLILSLLTAQIILTIGIFFDKLLLWQATLGGLVVLLLTNLLL